MFPVPSQFTDDELLAALIESYCADKTLWAKVKKAKRAKPGLPDWTQVACPRCEASGLGSEVPCPPAPPLFYMDSNTLLRALFKEYTDNAAFRATVDRRAGNP